MLDGEMNFTIITLTAATLMASTSLADAQELQIAGAADVIAGIEGGGSGYASGIRRTRTTLRFGADLWVDEWPNNSLGVAGLVEIEPAASFGAEIRYQRRVAGDFVFHIGATAVIAPKHMIGATFGAAYRLDVTEILELNIGPMGTVYFMGADLPDDQVLWQTTIGAGVRVEF